MIAIHHSGEWSFRPEWEVYCEANDIEYKLVNAYDSDIIDQLKDCSAFLFHHHHTDAKDYNFAKQLLFALEQKGMKVFPNFNTGWHFDDKLGQKYLLEAIDAPLVPTYAFYDELAAKTFVENTTYPKVYKLRGGAGSNNVGLLKNKKEALRYIKTAFTTGFDNYNASGDLKEVWRRYTSKKANTIDLLKSIRRLVKSTEFGKTAGKERGYVLLQEFIPNNTCDIRVVAIGDKAFAIKRPVRSNDFRASGSGIIIYNKEDIDERCIEIAFDVSERLKAQCVAYDFVFNIDNKPLIVEINYGFAHRAYDQCPGFWDKDMNFVKEKIDPCGWMIEKIRKTTL